MFTNPPFGGKAKIDDGHVLEQYELTRWQAKAPRSTLPAEQLFVETALKFLKPGGHLIIVLPDGILNNLGLKFIRSWLLRRARLVASIDLPKTTFAASGGINNRAVPIYRRHPDGREKIDDDGNKIVDDEITAVPPAFQKWVELGK